MDGMQILCKIHANKHLGAPKDCLSFELGKEFLGLTA